MNAPRKPRHPATVLRVQRLTPRMVRIVFGGPALAAFNWNGPAAHIKLIMGAPDADPDSRPLSRTYTPRHFDAQRLELTVDFVLPRARKGKKDPKNLVAACRPCNRIKGGRVFANFDEAKTYVLQRRTELKKQWGTNMARLRGKSANA